MRGAFGLLAVVGLSGLSGCNRGQQDQPQTPARPFAGAKIGVAAVGDPEILKTVSSLRGEWQQEQGAEVAIREGAVEPRSAAGAAEVLIFPGDRLGDLVDVGALAALPAPAAPKAAEEGEARPSEPKDPFAYEDILPAFREQVTRYGEERMALPYGGSGLVLVYRRDVLANKANLAAAEEAGVSLNLPKTWEQLDALAKFLHGRDWDGDGSPDAGLAAALGPDAEGVGEAILLARAVGFGLHPDHFSFLFNADTMEPRIATPPFVEALTATAAWKALGPKGAGEFDAEAARVAFRSGKAALLIDRAEKAGLWADPKEKSSVGVAPLPGAGRIYDPERQTWEKAATPNRPSYLPGGGGWLVGLSASAAGKNREAAIGLIHAMTGPAASARLRSDRAFPMLPTRTSQLIAPEQRAIPGVVPLQWSKAVADTLSAPRVVPGLRIPDARGYLSDLGAGRIAAVGGLPVEEALRGVAKAWEARTKALGAARQVWHYRRSLNTFETTPEPPAR